MIPFGEQLQLDLRMPFNGYNPRSLTRGSRVVSLPASGTGRVHPDADEGAQLTLFPEEKPLWHVEHSGPAPLRSGWRD